MNQCDGCNAHAPTYTKNGVTYHRMGDARYADVMVCQAGKYVTPSHDPNASMDPADLASLMSTEPQMEGPKYFREEMRTGRAEDGHTYEPLGLASRECAICGEHITAHASWKALAAERRGDSPGSPEPYRDQIIAANITVARLAKECDRLENERDDAQGLLRIAKKTSESQAARIQALEGVLVTIRGRASSAVLAAMAAEPSPPERVGSCVSTCDGIVILINETLDPHQPWCRDENHQGACISDPEERDDGE